MATPEEAQERTLELLEQIVDALDLDAEIEVVINDDAVTGTLEGEDLGLFIGKHGQTIDAVQHLATRIIQRDAGDGEQSGGIILLARDGTAGARRHGQGAG